MAYTRKKFNAGVGDIDTAKSTGRFVKAPGEVSTPAGAGAGQGYLDNQARLRRENPGPTPDYSNYGSLGEIERAQRSNNTSSSMPSVDVSPKSSGGPDTGGNIDLSKPNFNQVLEDFQGGELTRRQKRLIKKGRQDKARNIGGRRRQRTLKRGGEVSKSISKGSRKGEYRRSSRVVSQDKEGNKRTRRLESGGGSYDYKEKNKAKSATGGAYDLRAARKARRAKRNRA